MAGNVTNELLLEHLKAIQGKLAEHDRRFHRIERRLDPEDPRVLEREGWTVERLYLGRFRNALASLGEALNALSADPENAFLRDSAIKRFEYSYESATKTITRHLSLTGDDQIAIKSMSFQDKIRRAYEYEIGLIPNGWDRWWKYRDNRAAAHAYSKKRAERIVQDIPAFYREANVLLDNLSAIHEAEI